MQTQMKIGFGLLNACTCQMMSCLNYVEVYLKSYINYKTSSTMLTNLESLSKVTVRSIASIEKVDDRRTSIGLSFQKK